MQFSILNNSGAGLLVYGASIRVQMMTKKRSSGFDYDWLIVGSGFDGSVSAKRLSKKNGAVLSQGAVFVVKKLA
jgi:hypothetical protein